MLQCIIQSRTLSGADAINALRPFYFAVHPDFFGQHPKERVKILQWDFFVNVACIKDGSVLFSLLLGWGSITTEYSYKRTKRCTA